MSYARVVRRSTDRAVLKRGPYKWPKIANLKRNDFEIIDLSRIFLTNSRTNDKTDYPVARITEGRNVFWADVDE